MEVRDECRMRATRGASQLPRAAASSGVAPADTLEVTNRVEYIWFELLFEVTYDTHKLQTDVTLFVVCKLTGKTS